MSRTRSSLIRRVSDTHDAAAWAEFFELYEPLLHSYVRSRGLADADAADIVQEIFIKLVRALPKFTLDHGVLDASGTRVGGRGQFRTWLYQVTMSAVIDHVRRNTARNHHAKEWWERHGKGLAETDQPGEDWQQAVHGRVLAYMHEKVKAATNARTWYCYEQRFFHERSCADIAQELQITPNAVAVNAGRVFDKVSTLCTDYLEDEHDA